MATAPSSVKKMVKHNPATTDAPADKPLYPQSAGKNFISSSDKDRTKMIGGIVIALVCLILLIGIIVAAIGDIKMMH